MKKELRKIANTLLLYSYHIEDAGLLNGKMAIILYLYQYGRYANCKYYSEFADDLLDKVLDSIKHISPDFENGITGVGWGINYLIKNKYVEGDPNDILLDVDKRIFSQWSCNPITSMLGQGIYLLQRLEDNKSNSDFEKYINQLLDFCNRGISEYKGQTSLYHINSVLFFLIQIDSLENYQEKAAQTKKLLPAVLKKTFEDKLYDKVDLYIFGRLLSKLTPLQRKKWKDIVSFNSKDGVKDFDIEEIIKLSYLEGLYIGVNTMKPISLTLVSNFVKQKQMSLEKRDFLFSKGLAGLGNAIFATNLSNL
ncbi:hypothetical protein BDE36_3284 [Arcticibacter tournemirensis]|uniref:hypothetical protein n=1 Tax=Arcticibacter tournemirensis TaxID=699437 RepID=UPI00115243B4|nr:hypothetical protein [Arcticibacter tournemirensis]TQM51506.1 hypothetical protein BDE36_3284 [Arcticibacter tournemirensis]